MIAMSQAQLQRHFNTKIMDQEGIVCKIIKIFAIHLGQIFRFRLSFKHLFIMIMIRCNLEFADHLILGRFMEQEVYKYTLIVVIGHV